MIFKSSSTLSKNSNRLIDLPTPAIKVSPTSGAPDQNDLGRVGGQRLLRQSSSFRSAFTPALKSILETGDCIFLILPIPVAVLTSLVMPGASRLRAPSLLLPPASLLTSPHT